MIVTKRRIFTLVVTVIACTIVYVWSKSFVDSQTPIGYVSTAVYYTKNTGMEEESTTTTKPPVGYVSTAVYYTNNTGMEKEGTTNTEKHQIPPWQSYPKNLSSLNEVNLKRRFPDVIIIGVRKCGTTALKQFLTTHPLIKAARDEVYFFDKYFERGLRWYISRMPMTNENEVTLEKTASYFVTSTMPKNLYNLSRNVKLILIVRHPITRTVSDYLHYIHRPPGMTRNPPSFDSMVFHPNGTIITGIDLIDSSMYDIHYQRLLKWFDKKQIFLVKGEELIDNPFPLLEKIETFLNIPHYFEKHMFSMDEKKGFICWQKHTEDTKHTCFGEDKGRKHPTLSNSTWDKLREFFKPHSEMFCNLADVKYDWCFL